MRLCRPLGRLLATAGLAAAIAPAASQQARADSRLALEVLAFVHAIDASPHWSARLHGLSVDETSGTVTIGMLVVAAESGGLGITVAGTTLTGYAGADDGGFSAAALEVGKAVIALPGGDVALSDVRLADLVVPALAGMSYNRVKPFTSSIAVLDAIARSRISAARIAEIAVRETFEDISSLISYRNVEIGTLADGKLDVARAGPLELRSPADDPLATLTVARAEARAIDLDAFLAVYDPLRYVAGAGDGLWRQAIDLITYSDLTLAPPGIRLTLGSVTAEDVRVRQPPESFAPLIDAMTSEWKVPRFAMDSLRSRHLANLLSAFGADRLALNDLEFAAVGVDQLTLEAFKLIDASTDRLGEIAVEGFVAAIAGQGAVAIGRLALGDVVPPDFETVDAALAQARLGEDVDISSLVPKFGFFEAAGINIQAIDFPGVALGFLRADFDQHIGKVPTTVAVNLDDLDIATASLPNERLRGLVAGLGYERLVVDAGFDLNWREADETVSLDDLRLEIADFGDATASLALAGLTREAIEKSDDAAILDDLRLSRASLTFDDNSVVDRSLSMRAELLNIPLDRLKQQLAGALPLMLAFIGDAELVKEIVPVLQAFIKTPGTLTIEAAPASPVPIADIGDAIRARPQRLPELLAISVSGTGEGDGPPGADDAEPAAAPSDEATEPVRD